MSNTEINLDNLRPRPAFIDKIPGISSSSGTAIYPYVYVGKTLYENLTSHEPDQAGIALVLHEQEHLKRIGEMGVFKWYGRYFFSHTFRLDEEIEATKPQFSHLKQNCKSVDLDHRAKILSGPVYLWSTNYQHAYALLSAIWNSAE